MAEQGQSGLLTSVRWEYEGTETTIDAVLGATSLTALEAGRLSPDEKVWIGEDSYTVVSRDEETGAVEITPGLVEDIEAETPVVRDFGGEPGRYWSAEVVMPDAEQPLSIPLTRADLLSLPEGEYDPPRPVLVSDDLTSILDLPRQTPTIDGGWIDPDTMPTPVPTEPPAEAPVVEVLPGSGAAVVRWDAVATATEYDLHVHPGEEGDPNTAPLTPPDDSTLHTANAHSPTWVTHLDPQAGVAVPTTEGDEAFFAVVPRNAAGAGPASSWTPGLAGTINPDVLAASLALVQQVIAESVEAQGLSIGGMTWNQDGGLTIPDVVNFPPGGGENATLWAHLVARSLTVLGNLAIRGTNNEIAKGASVTLESGMTAPKAGPQFSAVDDVRATHGGFLPRGFAYHSASGRFWRVESVSAAVLQSLVDNTGTGGGYDFGFSNTNLSLQKSEITSGRGGVAFVGNNAYVLCETTEAWSGTYIGRYYVYKFAWQGWGVPDPNDRWQYVTRWPYLTEGNGDVIKHSPYHPCIGTDGTNLYVAQPTVGGVLWVNGYDTSGNNLFMRRLHQAGSDNSAPVYENHADVLGLVVSPADSGGAVGLWARFKGEQYVRAFDPIGPTTYGNRLPAWDFRLPLDSVTEGGGLEWDGTRFLAAGFQEVARMSQITSGTIEATQSWRRANPSTPSTSDAETDQSPVAAYEPVPRQWLRVESSAPIPDDTSDPSDADSVAFYIGPQGGTRYRVLPDPVVGGVASEALDVLPTSGTTAPAAFGFTAGTAARIKSVGTDLMTAPLIDLHGTGKGRVGPLEWNENGEAVVLDWVAYGYYDGPCGSNAGLANGLARVANPKPGRVPVSVILTSGNSTRYLSWSPTNTDGDYIYWYVRNDVGGTLQNLANCTTAWVAYY